MTPQSDFDWSVKDVVSRLWAWQQVSIARMEGGLWDREPVFPWLNGHSLAFVLVASYDHYQEHFEKLTNWLLQPGKSTNGTHTSKRLE